tara:strand:- start:637 stop:2760 length:2124 start_codon:yes stop_codon:yes gene_type:complete
VAYSWDCIYKIWAEADHFVDPAYGVGGYDDNDISVRCEIAGFRKVIAPTYVHHIGSATLVNHFPDAERGLQNAAVYLKRWEEYTSRDQKMVAIYRVAWSNDWDVQMFMHSIRKVGSLVDGIAIVIGRVPVAVGDADPEISAMAAAAEAGTDVFLQAITSSVESLLSESGLGHVEVKCALSTSEDHNERDERNQAIELGLSMKPDWMMSVDHDEVPEDRLTREHIVRLMKHPDPGVTHYDTGWYTHWDSTRLCRVDSPWCSGYKSSMRGFRIWRITNPAHQKILAGNEKGLHCGNIPDTGTSAKRVAAFRFRHYGYLRPEDRIRKYKWYRSIDPDPHPVLTQAGNNSRGGYDHLVHEEGMRLQPYIPQNGIGLTMLWHSGERTFDLMRWLDMTYGVVDKVVLVWTDEVQSEPSEEMRYIADRFGAEWILHPMQDDLAAARNSGVDRIRELGMMWCWVMDPDEHLPPFDSYVAIRRMAECTDSWAWMFKFKNYRPDGNHNWSENTRMFRLQGGILKFSKRVHETIEDGLAELGRRGVHPNVRYAPFEVDHYGLSGGDEKTQGKLQRYTRLLVKQLEDDPAGSPGAWVSLGLQFGNDGMRDEQWLCYEAAIATAGRGYLPFREAALHRLREGKVLMEEAFKRMSPAHALYGATQELMKVLSVHAANQPILGKARTGNAITPDVDLAKLLEALSGSLAETVQIAQDESSAE